MKTKRVQRKTFYEFDQNNSGGSFVVNKKLTHRIYIEAISENLAIYKAKELGVYFDGVENGQDCSCCGDRWNKPSLVTFPYRYGTFDLPRAKASGIPYKKTTFKFAGAKRSEPNQYDLIFSDVEGYAKYLAERYGMCKPDAKIFYSSGKIREI